MRILLMPVQILAKTGYGKQLYYIAEQLLKRMPDVEIYNVGGSEMPTYGASGEIPLRYGKVKWLQVSGDPHGRDVIPAYTEMYKFDIIISMIDIFAIPWFGSWQTRAVKVQVLPIDAENFCWNSYWQELCEGIDYIVAYSKFGFDQLMRSKLPKWKCRYIPHMIDCNTYRPRDDEECLKIVDKLYPKFDPEDFLFLHVGANVASERKRHYELLYVFKRFVEEVDRNAKLIMYTDPSVSFPHGGDYARFARDLGIEKNIVFPRMPPRLAPFSEDEMAALYSLADVFVTASEAEAFNVPLLEGFACELSAIGPANSANYEHIVGSDGFLVEVCKDFVNFPKYTPYPQMNRPPSLESLFEKMVEAYNSDLEKKGKKARKYALQFDCDVVGPKWVEFLEEIRDSKL